MNVKTAQAVSDAIGERPHPLLDFRSEEARSRTRWMVAFLAKYLNPGHSLLDVGCGSGKHTFQAQDLGVQATGIDCSRQMIWRANEVKVSLRSPAEFLLTDYTALPFGDDTFDFALFPKNIVECSYSDYERVLAEVKRILRKNGVFFVTMRDAIGRSSPSPKEYDVPSGKQAGQVNIPGKASLAYPTWFWTVAFANHVSSRYFSLDGLEVVEDSGTYLLRLVKN